MDIFEHFACHVHLPIKLKDVIDHILSEGWVRTIKFYEVDLNPDILPGFVRVSKWTPPYGELGLHGEVYYSNKLDEGWRRLVVCKELLHLRDNAPVLAQSREAVEDLIRGIRVPLSLATSIPTVSDLIGPIHALRILMPRDALSFLRRDVEAGIMTANAAAKLARIPDYYAEFMLSPEWKQFVDPDE